MSVMSQEMVKLRCVSCGKWHEVASEIVRDMGRDLDCMRCVDDAHVRFMRSVGRKQKLSCVPGCRCGLGGK